MVVDDSIVTRGALSRILGPQSDIRLVGNARNGREALERLLRLQPDVIVLDIEMPEMDGLQVLRVLREQQNPARILIFSAHTSRGAEVTIDALRLWAHDYILKPSTMGGASADRVAELLVSKIRALAGRPSSRTHARTEVPEPLPGTLFHDRVITLRPVMPQRVSVVAIAASTGGPKALMAILTALPSSIRVPILIVQHMPPMFTAQLAASLARHSEISICEGADGQILASGTAYIAPGGYHMGITRTSNGQVAVRIHDSPLENACRPAADVLFRDVAAVYGENSLAVVLTGMGRDGLAGARVIVAAGGNVIAQDSATSVVWSMPGHVATTGLACAVLPLLHIGSHIATCAS